MSAAMAVMKAGNPSADADAASPAAAADWLGQEPEIAEEEITAEYECDVLVIGAGTAGTFAAAAAVEEGAKTILI